MRRAHYEQWFAGAYDLEVLDDDGDEVEIGALVHRETGRRIAITGGVVRAVQDDGYATNFSLQWHRFRETQLDSYTGKPLYFVRFWTNCGVQPKDLYGKRVLEIGCGAGAFTEVLQGAGAHLVSVDLSGAVDANRRSNGDDPNTMFVQADLYDLPFPPESFDVVVCYGVLQHTPDPVAAYRAIYRMVAPGGRITIDHYAKRDHLDPWYQPKYTWRPLALKLPPNRLLRIIEFYIPIWLPIDMLIRRIPLVGNRLIALLRVPCWNHYELGLSYAETLRWAIMNTFDALGARYDFPMNPAEVRDMVSDPTAMDVNVYYGGNGVVANVRKSPLAASARR
jgi:SAM-dependent methyltransferase